MLRNSASIFGPRFFDLSIVVRCKSLSEEESIGVTVISCKGYTYLP